MNNQRFVFQWLRVLRLWLFWILVNELVINICIKTISPNCIGSSSQLFIVSSEFIQHQAQTWKWNKFRWKEKMLEERVLWWVGWGGESEIKDVGYPIFVVMICDLSVERNENILGTSWHSSTDPLHLQVLLFRAQISGIGASTNNKQSITRSHYNPFKCT